MTERKMKCMVYDRTVGYFAPTDTMHKGKQEEQSQRKRFDANAYCRREFQNLEATA